MKLKAAIPCKPCGQSRRRFLVAALSLSLAGLAAGCKTPFRTIDDRFRADPAKYRRVQILPVWIEGAGNIDRSLTTNELQTLCLRTGQDVLEAVQRAMLSKDYQIIGPRQVQPFGSVSFSATRGEESTLQIVQMDLCENLRRSFGVSIEERPLVFWTNSTLSWSRRMGRPQRPGDEPNPFHYRMTRAFRDVIRQFGATNSEAVLLVDTKAFFESKNRRIKRAVWNWTGGGLIMTTELAANLAVIAVAGMGGGHASGGPLLVDPFWHSSNSLQHSFALVDTRTREVLWFNQQAFARKDPRDPAVVAGTVAGAMQDLPPVFGLTESRSPSFSSPSESSKPDAQQVGTHF